MAEARRFKIKGKLKEIVKEVSDDHARWMMEANELTVKCGFNSAVKTTADFFSGKKLCAFAEPLENTDLSIYRKPNKNGFYYPRAKEGKEIQKMIDDVKDWSLSPIWEYIGAETHPFGGNMGIYQDKNTPDGETLFFAYDEKFKGHEDLVEMKLSEYYALIGK